MGYCARVEISGPLEDPIQGDGDIIASLPAEITLRPAALNLVMPAPGEAPKIEITRE